MNRPLLPLAPLAPAVAIIALAAASAAAQSLTGARNVLEDIQVGEQGRLLRIALVCRDDCRVGARAGGAFYLPGVEETIEVDLTGRSQLARALAVTRMNGGSALTIRADLPVVRASIKPCMAGGGPASCIDLEFADNAARVALGEPVHMRSDNLSRQASPGLRPETAPAAETAAAPIRPLLREAPDEALLRFARFAPPERFAPPAPAAPVRALAAASTAAGGRNPNASIAGLNGRRPIVRREEAAAYIGADIDIAAMARTILDKQFGVVECDAAAARLKSDAWALEAMVDVGFCRATAGDLEGADDVFERLLEYTPDNYEALVGRALVAAKAGEKSVARKYFQDALNAAPPIAESDRIVEAMARL